MKKRLNIGIFMDDYYPNINGVILVIDNLARELSKDNDVTVVVPNTKSRSDDGKKPYNIVRIKSIPVPTTEYNIGLPQFKLISKDFKKLVNMNFDVIHIHSPFTVGALGLKVAKECHIPCIATIHTRFDIEFRKKINSKLVSDTLINQIIKPYNEADRCIAINNAMIKVFRDYGYKGEPVVIYNGTDLKPLENKEENIKKVNEIYDLKKNDKVLLFVGRITSIKNIFFILDSLKLLKEDGYKFKMIYVGEGEDLKKLTNKIKEYNMEDCVITAGRIDDRTLLSAIYARADLFLFPSLFDASSLVQIEAAINETPGLFIEGSVTSDTVENDISGFTCALDEHVYKDKIKEILDNPKHLKEVSKNAKEMLGKPWDKIAIETYNLYIDEINRKNNK